MAKATNYTIRNTQGDFNFTINVGTASGPNEISQTADLTFYGYGKTGWGQEVDRNFYRLLENFACDEITLGVPKQQSDFDPGSFAGQGINNPTRGQTWFNLTSNELYICTNGGTNTWKHVVSETYADAKYLSIAAASGTGANAFVKLDGSNTPMTGNLILNGDPTLAAQAATKQYVDTEIATGISGLGTTYLAKAGDFATGGLAITGSAISGFTFANQSAIQFLVGSPTGNAGVEMGNSNGSVTTPVIDFHSSGNNIDYDSRIIANGGSPSIGQGTLQLVGNIVSDGRVPTLANQFVTKSWTESSISTSVNALSASVAATYLARSGGTMTGTLTLAGNPASALQAAPKQYVDLFLPKSGGSMSGYLTLNADPVSPLHAATKQYVDSKTTPSGQRIGWGDMVDVALAPLNVWKDVIPSGFINVVTPAGATFVSGMFGLFVEHKNHATVVNWRVLWNGAEVSQGASEGTGSNSFGFSIPLPFVVGGLTGSTVYQVRLQAYVRSATGTCWTNRGQITTTPTFGNIPVSQFVMSFS